MKNLAYFIIWLLTNSLVAQVVITSEDMLILNDSIQLPGTLKFNATLKEQPLIIYVPGSGNPDRNGNQPIYNVQPDYINQLSQAITFHDIAFFSYDKRNVAVSNLKYIKERYRIGDLVKDVTSIINTFKDDKRFSKIILIGHSQGSLVSMLAINDHVAKFISLAGLGFSADKAIIRQLTRQSKDFGDIAEQHVDELKRTGTIKEVNPMLVALFAKQNHDFLFDYFKIDPAEEIKKISIPILILNGTKDLQVTEDDARSLHIAQPNAKMTLIANMNHVLKIVEDKDNIQSYYSPDYPLSEELVTLIAGFIKE